MHIFLVIMIAISLSMDAFSLSLAYGTLNITNRNIWQLTTIVGLYHFFMPLLGMMIGNTLLVFIPLPTDLVVFVVLGFIGVQMILESRKKEIDIKIMSLKELLLFGLAVSLDSFSLGIGFSLITHHYIIGSLLFCFSSGFFTYLGLCLGKKINKFIGNVSTLIGGIILILIGFIYLF